MSGFVKCQKPSETSSSSISSGIPTLDKLIELSDGTVSCIYEDQNSFFHNTMLQTFVSSCTDRNQQCLVLSCEDKLLLRFLYAQKESEEEPEVPKNLLIAWRYKSMSPAEPKFKWNLLSKQPLPKEMIVNSLDELLCILKSKEALKTVIFSLFSPLFGQFTPDQIFKTLFEIKKYARLNKHTVFLSLPKFLVDEETSVFFDNIIQIRSNLLFPHETSYYIGYLELLKVSSVGAFRVNSLESTKYGIVLKTKKIKIERIDIPPDETVPSASCGQSF
ncbi:uncharacterized protein VICG_01242 [Vittaforma corneae ATCC 50505]|uniref:Elongator complex protein 4 n=1 Tax=Vittaforma corneae (strain ATCC 50505) TaxID=993615 RepID=L2GLH7_VITCO|nr:uncharacterized protein VICG_01242 [Vittaforma corneae ATCC 50505]ELA41738.1 hypothetical protein VICG_01242 [Vittaforma corneae ATCC 50505]